MKKYALILVAASMLAACNNQKESEQPVAPVVKEEAAVIKAVPTETVNIRDLLKVDPAKGAVIETRYGGKMPAADGPGIKYDLTLLSQENSQEGAFTISATYIEAEDGKDETFKDYGKFKIEKGAPFDSNAVIYKLTYESSNDRMNFLLEGTKLTLLEDDLKKIDSPHNYSLDRI